MGSSKHHTGIKRIKISISFFGVMILISLLLTRSPIIPAVFLAATIHEISHVWAARLLKVPLKELRLGIFGAALYTEGSFCSYKAEALVALAGPLSNIVLALVLLIFRLQSPSAELLIRCSAFLGLLNLLPVKDLDGGRIVFCIAAITLGNTFAVRLISVLSFISFFSLWSLSVYLLLRLGVSLSLFIFSFSLFCKIFLSKA